MIEIDINIKLSNIDSKGLSLIARKDKK